MQSKIDLYDITISAVVYYVIYRFLIIPRMKIYLPNLLMFCIIRLVLLAIVYKIFYILLFFFTTLVFAHFSDYNDQNV